MNKEKLISQCIQHLNETNDHLRQIIDVMDDNAMAIRNILNSLSNDVNHKLDGKNKKGDNLQFKVDPIEIFENPEMKYYEIKGDSLEDVQKEIKEILNDVFGDEATE